MATAAVAAARNAWCEERGARLHRTGQRHDKAGTTGWRRSWGRMQFQQYWSAALERVGLQPGTVAGACSAALALTDIVLLRAPRNKQASWQTHHECRALGYRAGALAGGGRRRGRGGRRPSDLMAFALAALHTACTAVVQDAPS